MRLISDTELASSPAADAAELTLVEAWSDARATTSANCLVVSAVLFMVLAADSSPFDSSDTASTMLPTAASKLSARRRIEARRSSAAVRCSASSSSALRRACSIALTLNLSTAIAIAPTSSLR